MYTPGKIRIAGVVRESFVDGPGIRFTVFCQGCPHHCPGCHNPATHDFSGGYECEIEKILDADCCVENVYQSMCQYLNIHDFELDLEDYLKEN